MLEAIRWSHKHAAVITSIFIDFMPHAAFRATHDPAPSSPAAGRWLARWASVTSILVAILCARSLP